MTSPINTKQLQVPAGYTVRTTTLDDAEAACKLWEIISIHMGVPEFLDPDEERSDWQQPDFKLADSSIVVEDAHGELVAIATLWDNSEIPVRNWLNWNLHPAHEGKGLEEFLIQWLENTAQRVIDRCPQDAKISLICGALLSYEPRRKTLEAQGYQHQRNFHRMKISLSAAPPEAQLAAGYSIRPMNYPEEFEKAITARTLGFLDHYGFVEESHETEMQHWTHYIETDKLFDASLYFLAIEDSTGEIAGLCWGRKEEHGDPAHAYVSQVAVLPQYRKKGLALALLQHTFGEFWRRGQKDITLYVDASSLTGATRLYEKAGMRPDRTWANYGKVIRDGVELATTSVAKSENN